MKKVSFTTDDGVTIVGSYHKIPGAEKAALLLHMMPANKESWLSLQLAMEKATVTSLAIDMRGHGESTASGDKALNYREFSDNEHQATLADVEAALQFLVSEGYTLSKISLVGASIGANLALQAAAHHAEIPGVVLLSPGLEYHGVKTLESAKELQPTQKLLTLSSEDDEYAFESSRAIYNATPAKKNIGDFTNIGHGTSMLERNPALLAHIAEWVK